MAVDTSTKELIMDAEWRAIALQTAYMCEAIADAETRKPRPDADLCLRMYHHLSAVRRLLLVLDRSLDAPEFPETIARLRAALPPDVSAQLAAG